MTPDLLTTAVLPGGDHRMASPDAEDGTFVPGFPDVVVEFVRRFTTS